MRACWLALVVTAVGLVVAGGASAQIQEYVVGHAPREIESAARSGNFFAFSLERRLAQEPGNMVFAPAGVDAVLSLLYSGAAGETAKQMNKLLHFTLKGDTLHAAVGELLNRLGTAPEIPHRKAPAYELVTTTALWRQDELPLTDAFFLRARDEYGCVDREVNFFQPEQARKSIDSWCKKATHGRIPEIVPAGGVDADTRVLLTHAIYFKGDWAHPFKKDATRSEPFHLTATDAADAPMMHQQGTFNYLDEDSLQAVELPYVGETLSMIILLPKQVDGLARLQASLAPDTLQSFLDGRKPAQVDVSLPHFQITRATSLVPALRDLGMADPFDGNADFSGMSPAKGLFVSALFHDVAITVDESGTEAAAGTAAQVKVESQTSAGRPKVFRADHPFLFLIRHNPTGSIVFFGRVSNPNG